MTYDSVTIRGSERVRRLSILRRLTYVCGGVVLALIVLLLIISGGDISQSRTILIELLGLLLGIVAAWVLTRFDQLELATHVLCLALIAATVATSLPAGTRSQGLYTLFIPIVGATLLLRPGWSLAYAGLALAAFLLVYFVGPYPETKLTMGVVFSTVLFGGYFGIVALLSFLAARGYERLLDATRNHADELERARAELEQRVTERTRDLQEAMENLQRSAETIQQMSVPVVPIADGVLMLPLVGALDSQRAALLTEKLLEAIQRERARMVMIDITGVPLVDTHVAGALLRAAQAVRLLGAEPVLVGIRAEIAQTVVGLGLDLSHITSRRDLRSGLAYALESQHAAVS